jgi:hypothetical protein
MEILFMKPDNDSGKQRSTDFLPVGLPAKRNDFQSAPYANTELPFLHMEIRGRRNFTVSGLPVISQRKPAPPVFRIYCRLITCNNLLFHSHAERRLLCLCNRNAESFLLPPARPQQQSTQASDQRGKDFRQPDCYQKVTIPL